MTEKELLFDELERLFQRAIEEGYLESVDATSVYMTSGMNWQCRGAQSRMFSITTVYETEKGFSLKTMIESFRDLT